MLLSCYLGIFYAFFKFIIYYNLLLLLLCCFVFRNLNINEGLCNGTRMKIISMKNNVLQCQILTGSKTGTMVFIPRITISTDEDINYTMYRHQFPVKLAFAMTINKSQGQTFGRIGIDLRSQCFTHGQAYVAFSRAKQILDIFVRLHPDNTERKIRNPVCKWILEN